MKGSRFAHLAWVVFAVVAVVCLIACVYEYWKVSGSVFREAGDLAPVWILLGAAVLMGLAAAFMRVLEDIAASLEILASRSGEGRS